jgi:hypothetical protein
MAPPLVQLQAETYRCGLEACRCTTYAEAATCRHASAVHTPRTRHTPATVIQGVARLRRTMRRVVSAELELQAAQAVTPASTEEELREVHAANRDFDAALDAMAEALTDQRTA